MQNVSLTIDFGKACSKMQAMNQISKNFLRQTEPLTENTIAYHSSPAGKSNRSSSQNRDESREPEQEKHQLARLLELQSTSGEKRYLPVIDRETPEKDNGDFSRRINLTNSLETPIFNPPEEIKTEIFFRQIKAELTQGSNIHPSLVPLNLEFVAETPGAWEIHELLQLPIRRFTEGNSDTGEWNRPHQFGAAAFFKSESGQIFNAKVANPRPDGKLQPNGFGGQAWITTGKFRRYEAVKDGGNRVFYPNLSDEVRAIISLQQGIQLPSRAEIPEIWPWILDRPEISVGITEGAKKALALCSTGFLCVALYGVANWSVPLTPEEKLAAAPRLLMPELATLGKDGRSIPVWYDQDNPGEKLRTFLNVKAEGNKVVAALKAAGADRSTALMFWATSIGKGIDDAIVALKAKGENLGEWLLARISRSEKESTYSQAKRLRGLAPDRPIEKDTVGGFFTDKQQIQLQQGKIHAIIAATGSGKTTAIRKVAKDWIDNGGFVVLITPTNKLGEQNALEAKLGGFGLPHRHDYYHLDLLALAADDKGGLITCPDSLYKILPLIPTERSLLVIMDEADQSANHITDGQTLRGKFGATARSLEKLLTRADSVILAEAQLPESTLKFYESLASKPTLVFRHRATGLRRQVTIFNGQVSGFERRILDHLDDGKKLLIAVDSQREGEKLECLINREFPHLKGLRVDRLTAYQPEIQALTRNPNQFLAAAQLDYLLISPAIKSGWDLTGQGYSFDLVCGIFRVLALGDQIQMPARWRPDCPWEIFTPDTIQTTLDESRGSARALVREAETDAAQTAQFHGFPYEPNNRPEIEAIIRQHRAVATTRAGLEKRIAHYALVQRLQEDGHQVTIAKVETHRGTKLAMREITKEIEWDWAKAIASTPIGIDDDSKEAQRLSAIDSPTPEQRAKAEKIRLLAKCPGINFDLEEICYYATANYKTLLKSMDLQVMAENLPATIDRQRETTAEIFSEEIVAAHHLPKNMQRAFLIDAVQILPMLLGQRYLADSDELRELKERCLVHQKDFKKYFRLDFGSGQTPASYFTRLARKLGHNIHRTKPGTGSDRVYCYGVHTEDSLVDQIDTRREELQKLATLLEKMEEDWPVLDPKLLELRDRLDTKNLAIEKLLEAQKNLPIRENFLTALRSVIRATSCKDDNHLQLVALTEKYICTSHSSLQLQKKASVDQSKDQKQSYSS